MYEVDVLFSAVSNNTYQGYVSVLTTPTCQNRMATVKATPYNGFEFDHWSDGSTSNPYTLYAYNDMTLVGYFRRNNPAGIDETDQQDLMVYGKDGTIIIKGETGQPFFIYNTKGQCIYNGIIQDETAVKVSNNGLYFIRFSNGICKKVFVN